MATSLRLPGAILCCIIFVTAATTILFVSSSAIAYEAYAPNAKSIDTVIYGDGHFVNNIELAMGYLDQEYPAEYTLVNRWISEIHPTDTYTRIDNNGICYINDKDIDASCYWLAGVLIHEAQHTEDDHTYFLNHTYTAKESEARALEAQGAYLGSVNHWTPVQIQSWVDGYLATDYWETIPAKYGESIAQAD
ncbi:MAG TPA: hypothetical protein VK436_07715 [Methanocella sp.]|nr:hypothetical protein [Methanocella sp.]